MKCYIIGSLFDWCHHMILVIFQNFIGRVKEYPTLLVIMCIVEMLLPHANMTCDINYNGTR